MARNNALERIKRRAYGATSDKLSALERIKSRTQGVGGYSYYSIDKWQKDNEDAINVINGYQSKIQNGDWMSSEDRQAYKSAIDKYTSSATNLRNLNRKLGTSYTADEEKSWNDSLSSLGSSYDEIEKHYSQWRDEDDYRGIEHWLEKPSQFDDGWQFGDGFKAVAGTLSDLKTHLGAGMLGIGEGLVDALATLGPYLAQGQYYANGGGYNIQADQAFNNAIATQKAGSGEFVKKDLYDEDAIARMLPDALEPITGINIDQHSVLGGKADSVVKSSGQMLGTIALQGVGVPWWLTTGATSLGGEAENALRQGASLEEAAFSGLVSAGAEILTEKLFGGIKFVGGQTVDDVLLKPLMNSISNKTLRTIVSKGVDIAGEGLEEVFSGMLGAVGQKLSYASEQEWKNLFSSEDALDSLIGGVAMSLGLGGASAKVSDAIVNTRQGAEMQKAFGKGVGADITAQTLELNGDNKYAQKLNSKLEGGKNLSAYQTGKILGEYKSEVNNYDIGKVKAAAESRLTELGETGDVSAIADAIARETVGEELSFKDRAVLNKSTKANIVLTEMMPENIKGGNLANKWAESIGTKRVNADVYNLRKATVTPKAKGSTEAKIGAPAGDVKAAIEQAAKDKVGKIEGFTEETANVMVKDYDGSVSPSEYVTTFEEAFKLGRDNAQVKELTRLSKDSGVIGRALLHAYDAGLQSRNVALEATNSENSVLQNGTESGIINTESESITNEGKTGTKGIRLRNSGKWFGGKNTEGQIRRMEGGAGQNSQWREGRGRPADGEATRLLDERRGREVRVADLGILNGSKQQKVRVIENEADFTTNMKQAYAAAKKHGLTAKFFVGDNILIEETTGNITGVRGYILGNTMLIRADYEYYTSDQIARHEAGHDMIAKGQVDIKAVRKRLEETVGKEAIDSVAQAYAEAYGRTGLSADEIWEECICDSLGDMNIFTAAGLSGREGKVTDAILAEIKAAAEGETKAPTQTRGSPEGKASRDMSDEDYKNFGWVRDKNVISAGHWKSFATNFADAVERNYFFNKTPNGELMIEAYNYYDPESVADVIVFAKGTIESPIITQIIRINSNNNQVIEDARLEIYAFERRGVHSKAGGLLNIYTRANTRWISNVGGSGYQNASNNNQLGAKRSRSEIAANPVVKSEVNEDAGTVTVTYKNGDVVTEPWGKGKASRELDVDSTEYKINTSMTMAEAKRMIDTTFKVNEIAKWYEGEYVNADEWLKKAGADEVEMYIDNDYDLQEKYINSNEDILNEEYSIRDVLNAYLAGTLIGKEKPKPVRLDVSQSTRLKDERFYSPQKIEDAKKTFEIANQKAVGKDEAKVNRARAEILLFAHNKGAAELLGVTQSELNKKLRSWSRYSATAKKISEAINEGVAEENRWTGIENCSYVSRARVSNEDLERLVGTIEGDSRGYERKYIARVMLAADTHIDYSGLNFKFASSQQVNEDNKSDGRVLGFYRDEARLVEVSHDKPNTVAHEMGHYIDAQWGRELVGSNGSHLFLSNGVNADIVRERYGEQGVQFLKNFKLFINSLSDVNTNLNAYQNDRKEIFARFFARFVEWTDNIATGNSYYRYETTRYNDQFTQAQYLEFARLLQEKALLDGTVKETTKYSRELDIDAMLEDMDWEDLMELGGSTDVTLDDISEELSAPKKKVEIFFRRKGLGNSYIAAGKSAVMKQSRIDEAIEDSGAKFNPDYARKYITRISPKDFIDLTVTNDHTDRQIFDSKVIGDHGSKMGEYDYNKALQDSRNPYLHINKATGEIIGHNGRHRMRALELAGIESVEIEIELYDEDGYLIKYGAKTIDDMAISSQFDTAIETHISNVIPLNEAHRAEIESRYGEKVAKQGDVKYSRELDLIDYVNDQAGIEASEGTKSQQVANLRQELERSNVSSGEVMAIYKLAEKMFDRYGGESTISEFKYGLLEATKLVLDGSEKGFDAAYDIIHALAREVAYNPKNLGGEAEMLAEIKREIRGTKMSVHKADKTSGEFDKYGGYGAFRKNHLGKFMLANEGIQVDAKYAELQNIFGKAFFPDVNTVSEQLLEMARLMDTPLSDYMMVSEEELEATSESMVNSLFKRLGDIWNDASKRGIPLINPNEIKGTVSNRELLATALESITEDQKEKNILRSYKAEASELNKAQKRLLEVRTELKSMWGQKGEKVDSLRKEKAELEAKIDKADQRLVRIESMEAVRGVIQRERSKAYKAAAEKGREALHRNVEGRHESEARAKIKKLKQKFQSIIEHPTDRQYIPVDLMSAMIDVCDLIDTSSPLYKTDGSVNKAQQARNEQAQRLLKLKAEYDKLAKSADYAIAYEYEQEIADYIQTIMTDYANKNIADMTLEQLTDLYQMMRSIEETLRDARRLIGWSDAMTVYEAGDSIIEEQAKIGEKRKQNGISKVDDSIVNLSLSPVRAVLRMAGYNEDSALYHSIREFVNGTREQKKFVMDAVKKFEGLTTGKNASTYEKAIYDPYGKELIDKNGKKFHVTKMQMMQAIMSYEREMANDKLHHVSNGGFTFADIKLLGKGEIREAVSAKYAHTITLGSDVAVKFMSELANDKWAQEYMAEARNFFDVTAKEAINEANMKLKHRIIATGKNYIPYEVNSDFIVREINSENDIQQVISGYGMLKDLKEGASQPLIITGLNNVLDRHIEQVGNVAALAVPIRNFNKIWNVKSTDGSTTVREKIKANWGTGGEDLITQAVKDVQGTRRQDNSPIYKAYKKVKSGVIAGTFLGNWSVVLKQIGSMYTATSMLNYRDPASMMANLIATKANRDAIAAEVNKYTAVAWVRGQGLSDAELYDLKTTAKKSKVGRAVDKLPPALNAAKWITQMDYDVALSLWKYAKEDTAKRTGLKGEELLRATADYYNDVIENTQSMSDALHRPEVQKSDNIASELLGIFKTDLYQNAGLLRVAFESRMAKPSKETTRALVKAVCGTLSSMCWASLITSVMAAFRYKVGRYRDEEDDEITLENWLKVSGGDMLEEMFGYMLPLFGSEAAGLLKAWITGETYEFDNLTLEAINGLSKAMTSAGKLISEGEDEPEKILRVLKNLLVKGTSVFGVPANNVTRFFDAMRLHAQDIANGEFMSFEAGLTSPNNTRLYRAYIEGDADKINKASRLYKDEAALKAGLRKGLRDNDPRLREAAIAKLNGDNATYNRLRSEVIAEGKFDRTIVEDAFAAEYNAQKNKADEEGK